MTGLAQIMDALAALAVLPALYLGVRLEIDRCLFQHLADLQDANGDDLAALDQALAELGWKAEEGNTRPLAARVKGTMWLLRMLVSIVGGQVIVLALGASTA